MAGPSLFTAQVPVSTTATLLAANRPERRSVTIVQNGTVDMYIGPAGVTAATGALLVGVRGSSITLELSGDIYAVVGAASSAGVIEVF